MTVRLSFEDLNFLNYAGVSLDDSYFSNLTTGLDGDAKKNKIAVIKKKFAEDYNYGKFLKIYENSLPKFKKLEGFAENQPIIVSTLEKLASDKIQEEKKLSWIYKIFHKIGQWFKGHGFRTEGEWGIELANRFRIDQLDSLKSDLIQCMSPQGANNQVNNIHKRINELSEKDFIHLLESVIFKPNKDEFNWRREKFDIYKLLNDDKKIILKQTLLNREDWYSQVFEILKGVKETKTDYQNNIKTPTGNFSKFINDKMVEKFEADFEEIVEIYKNNKGQSNQHATLFKFFLGESIERCVAYKDYTRIFAYYNKFAIPTVVKEVIGQLDEDKKTAIENNTAIKLNK